MTALPTDSSLASRLHGRYRIERLLGRGGMGAVYLARDLQLDRQVAIKELPAEFAGDAVLRERFLREVRTAAGFSHPNIVPVYGVEADDQVLAYVMGLVEGESLADRVRRTGPLGRRDAVRLLQDVGYALAYAHGRGVVHRDLKPDNIMLERATGRALLMDFGVARAISAAPAAAEGMTRVGEVVGTPEYMSPEQATAEQVDGRSDLYSLGLTAYFALTGAVPFGGDSVQRILVRQLTEQLPPLATHRADLPASLCDIVDRCLAKDRSERFESAEAMVEALEAAQVAAPEIPAAIRVLAAETSNVILVSVFTMLMGLVATNQLASTRNGLAVALPAFVLVAVTVGRWMQLRSETKRLIEDGFSAQDIRSALDGILEERAERRAQLRANPAVRARRKRTVRTAVVMIAVAVLLMTGGLWLRRSVDGHFVLTPPALIMVVSAMIMIGFGFVLLLRNPLEASREEKWLRRLWQSRAGAWFLGISDGQATTSFSGTSTVAPARARATPPVTTSAAPAQSPGTADDQLVSMLRRVEERLDRIERAVTRE